MTPNGSHPIPCLVKPGQDQGDHGDPVLVFLEPHIGAIRLGASESTPGGGEAGSLSCIRQAAAQSTHQFMPGGS